MPFIPDTPPLTHIRKRHLLQHIMSLCVVTKLSLCKRRSSTSQHHYTPEPSLIQCTTTPNLIGLPPPQARQDAAPVLTLSQLQKLCGVSQNAETERQTEVGVCYSESLTESLCLSRSCEPCRISKIRCDHATPTCEKCKTRGIIEQVSTSTLLP